MEIDAEEFILSRKANNREKRQLGGKELGALFRPTNCLATFLILSKPLFNGPRKTTPMRIFP